MAPLCRDNLLTQHRFYTKNWLVSCQAAPASSCGTVYIVAPGFLCDLSRTLSNFIVLSLVGSNSHGRNHALCCYLVQDLTGGKEKGTIELQSSRLLDTTHIETAHIALYGTCLLNCMIAGFTWNLNTLAKMANAQITVWWCNGMILWTGPLNCPAQKFAKNLEDTWK